MNYPLISEYIEAIKSAEDNFDELKHLRLVLDEDGEPVMTSGNFAVVFKMRDEQTGKLHAVKCFLKDQEGRSEAYRMIADELEYVSSTFLTPIKYLDKELFVDSKNSDETEFPVLLMDWVEGQTLDKYLRENLDDKYALEMLAYRFSQLAQWLIPQPFAHGDLKPDNILVREDGTLVLVDYDGMYVPAMKGQRARELGSPDFRHPQRTEDDFDEHIDDFPIVSILLSLKAISIKPQLLGEYGAPDRLLYSDSNYIDLLKEITYINDSELNNIKDILILSVLKKNIGDISQYLELSAPQITELVTKEELANAWKDEKGVRYSQDKRRLLKGPIIQYIKGSYCVSQETKVICYEALCGCWGFENLLLPKGLVRIGDYAFYSCRTLKSIEIPNSVSDIGKWSFYHSGLVSLSIPNSVNKIGEWAFAGCEALKSLNLSNGISKLENGVFSGCYELVEIVVPKSVKSIGKYAFSYCKKLKTIYLPEGIMEIGEDPFAGCESLLSIIVPKGTKWMFENLLPSDKDIIIEIDREKQIISTEVSKVDLDDVWTDEYGVIYSSDRTRLLKAPTKQIKRGNHNWTISVLNGTYSVIHGTQCICDKAFLNCYDLKALILPQSVKQIGVRSFQGCSGLCTVDLNDGLIRIGDNAFQDCKELHSIQLPESLKQVGNNAFSGCRIKVLFTNLES